MLTFRGTRGFFTGYCFDGIPHNIHPNTWKLKTREKTTGITLIVRETNSPSCLDSPSGIYDATCRICFVPQHPPPRSMCDRSLELPGNLQGQMNKLPYGKCLHSDYGSLGKRQVKNKRQKTEEVRTVNMKQEAGGYWWRYFELWWGERMKKKEQDR